LDEYTKRHSDTGAMIGVYGSRKGLGGINSRWHIVNPDKFDPDKTGDEDAARKRAKDYKDVYADGEDIIRERISGATRVAVGAIGSDEDASDTLKTQRVNERKMSNLIKRKALETAMEDWMNGLPAEELASLTPTMQREWLDKNQSTIMTNAIKKQERVEAAAAAKKLPPLTPTQINQKAAAGWLTPERAAGEPADVPEVPVVTPPKAIPVAEDDPNAPPTYPPAVNLDKTSQQDSGSLLPTKGKSVASTNVGSDLTSMVKGFEGWKPKAYSDNKQISIGYGTRARKGETTITKAEGEKRLASELNKSRVKVLAHAKKHNLKFNKNQIDALTSFGYNIGSINELTANGTRTNAEIAAKILEYNKEAGKKSNGLVKRRKAEQKLFLS
jgi:GH24 family phage-related lysozyme (muramidase)